MTTTETQKECFIHHWHDGPTVELHSEPICCHCGIDYSVATAEYKKLLPKYVCGDFASEETILGRDKCWNLSTSTSAWTTHVSL